MAQHDVSHYYRLNKDGTVVSAYGASLKEAREGGLFASATMALKMVANPGLDIWIRNNLVQVVIDNPRGPMESPESYKERILNLGEAKRTEAADFGSKLHAALEHYPMPCHDPIVAGHYDMCQPWLKANVANVLGNEVMLAHRGIGFAGKTDLVFEDHAGQVWIVDFKTTGFKKTKTGKWAKPTFYQSWVRQLAFYAVCWQKKHGVLPRVVSLAINSGEPCEPVARIWTPEEQEQGFSEFMCAAYLLSCEKDHWPAGPWSIAAAEGGVHPVKVTEADSGMVIDAELSE